jgi:hypothetical protein
MDEMGHQSWADAKQKICFVPADEDIEELSYPVSRGSYLLDNCWSARKYYHGFWHWNPVPVLSCLYDPFKSNIWTWDSLLQIDVCALYSVHHCNRFAFQHHSNG